MPQVIQVPVETSEQEVAPRQLPRTTLAQDDEAWLRRWAVDVRGEFQRALRRSRPCVVSYRRGLLG